MAATTDVRTAGILLAAGASRRMGTNKLLLEFEGEPLVRRAVRRALAAGLDPVIVVLGHEADKVRAALADLDCTFALTADVGGAMSGSLHAGLAQLPAHIEAAVVMLADMPHVTEDMLRALPARAAETNAPLVVSSYTCTHAPPILFRRALFEDLRASVGEGAGRTVVQRHLQEAAVSEWSATTVCDIDTPEQLAASGAEFRLIR